MTRNRTNCSQSVFAPCQDNSCERPCIDLDNPIAMQVKAYGLLYTWSWAALTFALFGIFAYGLSQIGG